MCRLPVTFGGGSMMQNGAAPGRAFAPARKASAASHRAAIAGSAVLASKVLSMVIGSDPVAMPLCGRRLSYPLAGHEKSPERLGFVREARGVAAGRR